MRFFVDTADVSELEKLLVTSLREDLLGEFGEEELALHLEHALALP